MLLFHIPCFIQLSNRLPRSSPPADVASYNFLHLFFLPRHDLLNYFAANTDVWKGYSWFGVYAGQKGYHTPDQGFWYSIDPGGPDAQDFSGATPDDPRLKILLEGP